MNWVQIDESTQYHTDRLPTPVSTPRSTNDGHAFWQTPRNEVDPNKSEIGHTSPYTYQQGFANWTASAVAPNPGPAHQEQDKINVELAHHTYHLTPNPNLPLPPVESSRRLTSSPGLDSSDFTSQSSSLQLKVEQRTPSSVGTIQTPPPTSIQQRHTLAINSEVPTMVDPRRLSNNNQRPVMGPPETPSRIMQASPHFFPTLQFSPDLYQFQATGPASAPVFPQQRLFWDPASQNTDESAMRPYQDPFAHSQNGLINTFTSTPGFQDGLHPVKTLQEEQPYDLPISSRAGVTDTPAFSYPEGATFPAPFTTSPRIPPHRTEDPSLFLSSPARRFGGPEPSQNIREKPAYHHQIEESKREREFERARKAKAKRTSGIYQLANPSRRPASPAREARPELKRSATHSGIGPTQPHLRNQSHISFADSVSSSGAFSQRSVRGGRSSPLKSVVETLSLDPRSGRNRTSLSFAIDEDGRAKTIITKVSDSLDAYMDLDGSASSSDDDSLDESDFQILRSQQNSFAFVDQDEFPLSSRQPGHGPGVHSKNSSYSSTMASTNSAHHSSRTSSGHSGPRSRQNKGESLYGKSFQSRPVQLSRSTIRSDLDVLDEDDDSFARSTDRGDAQQALRAIIKDRPRSKSTHDGSNTNRRAASFAHFHSSPPTNHTNYAPFNASPTTITDPDAVTPSTDRESFVSNGSTRCICSSSSPDGQFMIQCESCSKWLHINCVGIDSKRIPEVYICVYCTQTPMRHGRIREPSRASALAPASPLAHKSQRFR